MAEFVVKSHSPQINAEGINRDTVITLILTEAIDAKSINYKTITIRDDKYNIITGEVYLDFTNKGQPNSIGDILVFKPSAPLLANVRYTVYLNKTPDCIYSVTGKSIRESYKFSFTTNNTIINNSDLSRKEQLELDLAKAVLDKNYSLAAEIQALIAIIDAGGVVPDTHPDDTPEPLVEYMSVLETIPVTESSNLEIDKVQYIAIKFNNTIDPDIDVSDFIAVRYKNVLD